MGQLPELLAASADALKLAQRSGEAAVQALALLRRSDALCRSQQGSGVAQAQAALDLYTRLGDLSGRSRAGSALAWVQRLVGEVQAARASARQAIAHAQASADARGLGAALNALAATQSDLAERMRCSQQAIEAYGRAGQTPGRLALQGNLANLYGDLGLYRRAQRLRAQCAQEQRRLAFHPLLATTLATSAAVAAEAGELATAQTRMEEYEALLTVYADPAAGVVLGLGHGLLKLARGQAAQAVRHFEAAHAAAAGDGAQHWQTFTQGWLAEALLASGKPRLALAASRQAVARELARSHGQPNATGPFARGGSTTKHWSPTAGPTRPGPRCNKPTALCWKA